MKIIPATHHHLSVLIELDTYAQQNTSRIDEINAWLDSQAVYLLEVNREVVGYGVIHHHFFSQPFIELIMIAKASRQKGYGKSLIAYFQKNSEGDKLFTSTNQSNHAMRNMLTQLGFIESGCIENLDENDLEIIYCFIQPK
ncbi:GNAT family N-acetyltransferase [Proteus sp. FME41]|uniref:GNAT family N-acetyltransferase n=1 Tax=Proteus sp. FME41 TaxID=2742608 RepID=UPI0018672CD4|nr:GNAT family N-acetyltransferase [Proteus sp. FME41]